MDDQEDSLEDLLPRKQRTRTEDTHLFNLKRLDINTFIQLVAFLVGGLYFVSMMSSKIDTLSNQLADFKLEFSEFKGATDRSMSRMTSRIDNVIAASK